MKCIVLTLIILLCFSEKTSAGCDPVIYAVCRIKLLNGNSKEGFIGISGTDCVGVWMNGFHFESAKQSTNYFLTLEFRKLIVSPDLGIRVISNDGRSDTQNLPKSAKLLFLQWAGNGSDGKESTEVAGSFTRKPGVPESNYQMFHRLTVFGRLTDYLYLPDPSDKGFRKYKRIKIPLNLVTSIELLRTPPRKWLAYIKQKRRTNPCYVKEDCEDYMEPEWYHEILADKEKYKDIKRAIEETLQRVN